MRNVYRANESAQLLPATDRAQGPEHHLRIARARRWAGFFTGAMRSDVVDLGAG